MFSSTPSLPKFQPNREKERSPLGSEGKDFRSGLRTLGPVSKGAQENRLAFPVVFGTGSSRRLPSRTHPG
eukprot:188907-Amorphochlora_amoeboformis.AAC.1